MSFKHELPTLCPHIGSLPVFVFVLFVLFLFIFFWGDGTCFSSVLFAIVLCIVPSIFSNAYLDISQRVVLNQTLLYGEILSGDIFPMTDVQLHIRDLDFASITLLYVLLFSNW